MLDKKKLIEYVLSEHEIRISEDDPIISVVALQEGIFNSYKQAYDESIASLDSRMEKITGAYVENTKAFAEEVMGHALNKFIEEGFKLSLEVEKKMNDHVFKLDSKLQESLATNAILKRQNLYSLLALIGCSALFFGMVFLQFK